MLKKLFVIGLLCASLGLAQRGGGGSKGGDTAPAGGMGMTAPPSKFDNIANTLNLNKDQKKAAKTILDEGAKEAAPLRDQISKSRIAVGEAITAKKSDEEIKQAARAASDLSAKLTQLELDTFAKIANSLDDAQKTNKAGLGRVLVLMTDIYHVKNWNE
jgi:hypothetical protein